MPPQFRSLTSHAVLLAGEDIDTDQIIPARYLKVTDKAGLGEGLFAGWRYREDGAPDPEFPLNKSEAEGAQILLTGRNFGCGSSREHAAWALLAEEFRAVIAPSFADIFRNNALKNGLLPAEVDPSFHKTLVQKVEEDPQIQITVDLEEQEVRLAGGLVGRFPIDAFSKRCLLEGVDSLGYLLAMEDRIRSYEVEHEQG